MPPKGKPKARAFKASTTAKSATPLPIEPPAPFTRPSSILEPFLEKLSSRHVYITHIDTMPWGFKRKIFAVPVLMNIAIIGGLIWRISVIGPYYMNICFSLMGRYNETTIDTANTPWEDMGREILRRTLVFMVDLIIYAFIWPWPRNFFAGQRDGNPVSWRFGIGFRDKEIIVRRSRKWDRDIGDILDNENGNQLLFENVRKAVDPAWMHEKTGYLMLNREWDLDWKAMVRATKLVDTKSIPLDEFKTTVLVHTADFGWLVIEATDAGGSAEEEKGRRKIVYFKEELTAMGKENLFFRWIELVQYESSQPGGFGPDRQMKTMSKAKEMFEAQGIDFDKLWAKVGGMDGMPGMDQV